MTLFAKPHPGTPMVAALVLVAVLIPSGIVTWLAGQDAGMAFGIAAGFVMAVAPLATTGQAAWSAVLAAALAAAANLAGSTPWAVAGLMLASAVLLAITNQWSAGLMTLAPIIVVLFGPGPIDLTWSQAFVWTLVGGLIGIVIVRALKFQAPRNPTPPAVAWRHALALGVLSAGAMYWALASDIPHGYWVAVTLVVALRPLPQDRTATLAGRLLGTLLGAVISLAVILTLPPLAAAAVATACLYLLAVYAMGGSYFMQTLFLTPMLLVFGSLGDTEKGFTITVERAFYTLAGVVIGVGAAFVLDRWDRRDQPEVTEPAEVG